MTSTEVRSHYTVAAEVMIGVQEIYFKSQILKNGELYGLLCIILKLFGSGEKEGCKECFWFALISYKGEVERDES